MRIGLLTDVYRPGFSGVANHVMLLKRSFEQMGHEVAVFAFENQRRQPVEKGVVYSPGMVVTANYPFGFFPSRTAAKRLGEMDILHAHQPFTSGWVALQEQRKRSVPVVFTSHTRYDLYSKAYAGWMPVGLATGGIRWYLRRVAKRVSLIISPSAEMRDLLKEWGVPSPIEVIPNGIELEAFRERPNERGALRRSLGLPEDAFVYLFVGRIAAEKNIDFLLECMKMPELQAERVVLALVGGGPKLEQTRERVRADARLSGKVILTGGVEYLRIPDYMHAADAFVTASKTEVHPLTVIEAAAAGLPAVGLHAPGVRSIIQDGVSGYLCAEETGAFSAKMLTLLRNPGLCQRMGQNAVRESEAYASERTAARVLAQYQKLLRE